MYDYSNYGQNNLGLGETENLISQYTGAVLALVVVFGLIALAIAIVLIIAKCKLYTKAGEKWWAALIPIWTNWVETRITGLRWYWFLIVCGVAVITTFLPDKVTYVGGWGALLVSFNYNYNLAKKFGKGNGFAFLNTILPIIGVPILAFGAAKYNKDAAVKGNGIFEVNW